VCESERERARARERERASERARARARERERERERASERERERVSAREREELEGGSLRGEERVCVREEREKAERESGREGASERAKKEKEIRGEGGGSQELFLIFACACAKIFAGTQRDSVRLGAAITMHAAAPPRNGPALFAKPHRPCSRGARGRAPQSWFAHSRVCQSPASALRLYL